MRGPVIPTIGEKMEKKILIVEDDDYNYSGMEKALHYEAVARDVATSLIRAKSLMAAKRALRDYTFHAVSVDMIFPVYDDDRRIEAQAGALFLYYLKRRHSTPCLLYSGGEIEESRKTLDDLDIDHEVPVYKKDPVYGHGEWAKAVLDL